MSTIRLLSIFLFLPFSLQIINTGNAADSNVIQQYAKRGGLTIIEAERYINQYIQGGHAWIVVSPDRSSSGGAMQALPNVNEKISVRNLGQSPRLDYKVHFSRGGKYYLWVRGMGESRRDDSLHIGLNGNIQRNSSLISGFGRKLSWSQTSLSGELPVIRVPGPGVHTINVWMNEDGIIFDKLVLTRRAGFEPRGKGPRALPIFSNAGAVPAFQTNDRPSVNPANPESQAGNNKEITPADEVEDTTAPILSLSGSNPVIITRGSAYIDNDVSAFDVVDGELTEAIVVDAGVLNTSTPGTYPVIYRVTDSAGNTTQIRRTIQVVDKEVILPEGWSSRDIGTTGIEGDVEYNDNIFTIYAAGSGINDTSDAFRFVYTSLVGDGAIQARVNSLDPVLPQTQAGVMIRESLTSDSRFSMVSITPANGIFNEWRASNSEASVSYQREQDQGAVPPYWLRLRRSDDLFEAYASENGDDWMLINAQTIAMTGSIFVGLAIASHDINTLTQAGVDNVNVDQVAQGENPVIQNANYYVATNGNNSSPGTVDEPYATLDKASEAARPGDLIYIRSGVYSIDLELLKSGTADNPITYESYPGELAIFDGSAITPGTNKQFVVDASWNVIRNIEVRNSPMRGMLVLGDDNIIENVRIHDSNHVGLQFYKAARNQAVKIVSYNNYDPQTNGENADGIQALDSRDTTIRDCRVYNNSDDGIDNYNSVGMVIDDCIAYHNGYDNGDGNGFKLGGGSGDSGASTVMRSIAFENKRRGFTYNGSNLPSTLLNNTAARNPVNYQFLNARHTLMNNISFQGELDLDTSVDEQNNSWNMHINDPQFISLDPNSVTFLQLESGSPARNAGTDMDSSDSESTPNLGAIGN